VGGKSPVEGDVRASGLRKPGSVHAPGLAEQLALPNREGNTWPLVASAAMRAALPIAVILAAILSVAAARAAPPSLSVSPPTVRAGKVVKIKGSADGCRAGNTVFILSRAFVRTHEFAGVPAVLATVRAGGSFRASTTIPRSQRSGRYSVTARCGGGNLGVTARLRVIR
jgi:hypothetical protein